MILYRQQPPDDVLIDYCFEKYPDCQRLIFYGPPVTLPNGVTDATLRTLTHHERTKGVNYTFSAAHLWALMRRDQEDYERLLPADAERTYA